jgi:O-antigen/teichoic acid export membrane protein
MSGSLGTTDSENTESAAEANALSTDHLLPNMGRRAVSGGVVTIAAQMAKFILNFAAAAVLARLLSPKEFGLVGMVLGVTGLVGLFKELGLSTATVQRDTITQQQVSNLFWINVLLSGFLTVISLGLAPLMARFYHDPRVTGIMMMLSLTFVLTGSTVQHQALLARQMRFRSLAIIEVSSMVIGFTTACGLAKLGFSYWALVAQQVFYAISSLLLTWFSSKWRPSMPKRNSGVRPMLSFGAHLTLADFLGLLMVNSDTVLIGRFFGAEPLGLYTRANVLLQRPLQQILIPISSVLTPVLSRLQNDSERYRRSFMRAYETMALVIFSFAAICLALAKPMVLVILGPKWSGVIPLFSAFAVVAVSLPLSDAAAWLFQSQGRGKEQLRNHALIGIIGISSYIIGLHWGPLGVAVTTAISTMAFRLPIVYYFAGRIGPVGTRDLWMAFLSHLPCWGAVYLATALPQLMMKDAAPIVQLVVCVPIGLAAGTLLFLVFRRPRESAFYVWHIVRNSLVKQLNAT